MKQPTGNSKDKVDNKKNEDESNTLENNRRRIPVEASPGSHGFIIPNCNHETNDQTAERKSFSKQPLEITSQAKEKKYNQEN